eukprot:CAMPEP_0119298756 /NCGR_PEP_ID=MMETSP1333-20130426/916_1 /TAXON_ID=418940 /ORGANISM="Scyphosphaera apsteinii, Strain RCC1455" /LENGTH=276 /DNA_ID=CAMNT_0007299949 /DNA_START=157 /DNA_END=987 /DNA_ORIENTATION=-
MAVAASFPPDRHLPSVPATNTFNRVLTGIRFAAATYVVAVVYYVPLIPLTIYSMLFDNERRAAVDWIVQMWARGTLTLLGSKISVEGTENLPDPSEGVLYVPNHCSFLDIFSLSGYLPRRFKYVSKIEILRIPLIGWAMRFAKHIAIRRTDRASQLATFKDAVRCLESGSSLVTFAEGTRSKDGRIMDFKKGPFTMAARAKVRVVPISIIGTHIFQPPGALVPYAPPRGVRIVIHPPLPAPAEKKEMATLKAAKTAIESALPPSMLPLEPDVAPRA